MWGISQTNPLSSRLCISEYIFHIFSVYLICCLEYQKIIRSRAQNAGTVSWTTYSPNYWKCCSEVSVRKANSRIMLLKMYPRHRNCTETKLSYIPLFGRFKWNSTKKEGKSYGQNCVLIWPLGRILKEVFLAFFISSMSIPVLLTLLCNSTEQKFLCICAHESLHDISWKLLFTFFPPNAKC